MTKKRNYTPRVPATECPHCLTRAIAYDSVKLDVFTREIRYVCQDADCLHTFVAQLGIFRTVRPSMKPNPAIEAVLPKGDWRSKPANDDQRVPANDDQPDAAEVAPSPT
ncbi:Ogr/Delta-like zinc finger protein [Sphingomonas sp. PP-F2F-G114-C0414]|uniref:ogr/Delta-like zinc finger family protein n=1 Tax=Sphingomonas sp. PP-F2F-G114-C0414 TaxID=2135662 RepID=UPI000EF96B8C|nr:ogr/Delta-like zinc finger family protein [Sphingomonas sp. PP-F2F-G114-C0414]RMB26230.1 Ogr/Delta-like zinc finger protein [Sphingomonas sp. PP-F2F-G114-C0414]